MIYAYEARRVRWDASNRELIEVLSACDSFIYESILMAYAVRKEHGQRISQ